MAYLAFAFVCCVWGSTFIVMERVSHALGPVELGIWRTLTAALALGAVWWFKRDVYHLDRKYLPAIFFSALVANVAPCLTQPYLLAQGYGHSFFGVIVAAVPLLTIIVSIPMLGVWPTGRQALGVLGGLVCLWFVVDAGLDRGMTWGFMALAVVVPLSSACNNTFVKMKLSGAQALPMTAMMLGMTGLLLLPLEFCRPAKEALDLMGPAHPQFTSMTFVYMLLLGVVATGLSSVAFFYMVFKQGPLFAGMTTYVVPMLAMGWGLLDHEQISTQQLMAMAGVFVMVGLVQSGARNKEELIELLPETTTENVVTPSLVVRREMSCPMPAKYVGTATDTAA
jgi:drug/metabolite transporter (DMT)-like permease